MGYAIKIYEAFREYGEEKAKVIAEAFEELDKRYPQIRDMATKTDLSETELRLMKEIELTRKEIKEIDLKLTREIKEVELRLTQQIEDTRKEIKEVELKLTREIENTRKEIKEVELKLTREIKNVESRMVKWMFMFWTGQVIAMIGIFQWFQH